MNLRDYISQEVRGLRIDYVPKGKSESDIVNLIILGSSKSKWDSKTAIKFTNQFPDKIPNKNILTWFLFSRGKRYCKYCSSLNNLQQHHKDSRCFTGVQSKCKLCVEGYYEDNRIKILDRQNKYKEANPELIKQQKTKEYHNNSEKYKLRARAYQMAKLNRTPKWADISAIEEFYLNRPEGYHVDHIIPLQGKKVSGLHVLENLQYLTVKENLIKSNKYIP